MNHTTASFRSRSNLGNSNSLFRKGLIRWQMLTSAEKFMVIAIVLIPGWWFVGWTYGPLLLAFGLYIYRLIRYKRLDLSYPSLSVVALLSFATYWAIIYKINVPNAGLSGLIISMQMWGAGGFLLWYIQSYQIRVRLQVVAWAFSIVVLQAMSFWFITHFI